MIKHKRFSLASQGLSYKLKIAFWLMSVLPLLVCVYLVSNYLFPEVGLQYKISIAFSIVISIFIAVVGFLVVKEIISSIISVTREVKLIASGDLSRKLQVERNDEIGDLSKALNQITERVRSNINELKSYSERTSEINIGIQRRVLVLSSLLQISALISQSAKLEDILRLVTEKSHLIANSDVAFIFSRDEGTGRFQAVTAYGINSQNLLRVQINADEPIYTKLIAANRPILLDKENVLPKEIAAVFCERLNVRNLLLLPIYLKGTVVAFLGVGNNKEQFLYKPDDIEMLDVFTKQVAIAIENDMLIHRVEKLEIKDTLTGLYNQNFIQGRLEEEIKRAVIYHRPCAFILLNVDDFHKFIKSFGARQAEAILKKIASLLLEFVSEIEPVARFGDNEFAIVLPEKNKRQAKEIAENIREKIELSFAEEQNVAKRLTVSGGVSENPLDGINADELIAKAKHLLNVAKKEGKNRILT